jgi:hypothetical protein
MRYAAQERILWLAEVSGLAIGIFDGRQQAGVGVAVIAALLIRVDRLQQITVAVS